MNKISLKISLTIVVCFINFFAYSQANIIDSLTEREALVKFNFNFFIDSVFTANNLNNYNYFSDKCLKSYFEKEESLLISELISCYCKDKGVKTFHNIRNTYFIKYSNKLNFFKENESKIRGDFSRLRVYDTLNISKPYNKISSPVPCDNQDFELANLSNWTYSSNSGDVPYITNPGTDPVVPLINTTYSIGMLPGSNSNIGHSACLDLLGSGGNSDFLEMKRFITVTNFNKDFIFYVAVIMDPGTHTCNKNAFFEVNIEDSNGNTINCSSVKLIPGSCTSYPGWSLNGGFHYLDWTPILVPLSPYIGQNVQLSYKVRRCTAGGHGVRAYIESGCESPSLICTKNDFCFGDTSQILSPYMHNYQYNWSGPAGFTANTYSVAATQAGNYSVSIVNIGDSSCSANLDTTIIVKPSPIIISPTLSVCQNKDSINLVAYGANTYTWVSGQSVSTGSVISSYYPISSTTYTILGTGTNGCINDTVTSIIVNPLPTVTSTSSSICLGQQTATLIASGAASYTWSPGLSATTGSLVTGNPISSTIYTVTGTDINGCVNDTTVNITVNTLPIVTSTSASICLGQQTATLIASGATSYTWSPGLNSTTGNLVTGSPQVSSNYTVTGSDSNGCTNATVASIVIYQQPILTVTNVSICKGLQTATLTVSGASTYSWSSGLSSTTGSLVTGNPTFSSTYTVTGIDINGCRKDTIANITVNSLPSISATSSSICLGQQTATLIASGAASYTWSPGLSATTGSLVTGNPTSSTIYTVTGTDLNGCVNDTVTNIIVYALPVITSSSSSICLGQQTATLTAGGGSSYVWSPGLSSSTGSLVTGNPLVSETYTVIGTDDNGCRNLSVSNIVVNSLPVLSYTNTSICSGQTCTLMCSGANMYNWYSNTNILTGSVVYSQPIVNTTYTLVGIDLNGCLDSISVLQKVYALPTAQFTSDSVCFNTVSHLTSTSLSNGNPLTNYAWDFTNDNVADITGTPSANNTFSLVGNNPVNFTVTSSPEAGLSCSSFTTQNVWVNPLPIANFSHVNNCINAQPNNFSASSSSIAIGTNTAYVWSYGDGSVSLPSITTTATHSYAMPGTYAVTLSVISNKGCSDTVIKPVEVYAKPLVKILNTNPCEQTAMSFTGTTLPNSGAVTNWNWDFTNTITSIEGTGQNPSFIFSTAGTQTVNLITITNHGCRDTIKKEVYVNYNPHPYFTVDKSKGCPVHCVVFTDNTPALPTPSQNKNWVWNLGDGTIVNNSTGGSINYCYNNTSSNQLNIYDIKLTVTTDSGCVGTNSQTGYITVYPKPLAQYAFTASDGSVVEPLIYFTNESLDYTKWWWGFGDGLLKADSVNKNPSHFYEDIDAKTYYSSLIVMNQYGCLDTAYMPIEITHAFTFYIPNAFTPNGDGINDIFTGNGIGIAEFELLIFDRWGEQIYKTDDINKGWNGEVNGVVTVGKQDVYIWKVKIIDVLGKPHHYNGHVTLLKQ